MPQNTTDKRVQRFKPGARSLSARQLNGLVDSVNRLTSGVNAPRQPKPAGKTGGSPVLVLVLVTEEDDYLVCEDADANEYLVAKPYELRRTPFDGETIDGVTYTYISANEREADNGVDDPETQFITPNYRATAEIFAVRVQGDTGVQGVGSNDLLVYVEIDQGRAWAWDDTAS